VLDAMYDLYETTVPQSAAVLFSDYGKGGLAHIQRMIRLARAAGKPVLVDPKGSDYARYTGASILTPNRAELAQVIGPWSNEAQLLERTQNLRRQLDLEGILLTRSEEGMSLFDAQGVAHVPAQAREVFDVTGAGDTVAAVMAALLACGHQARDAMPIANRAGGLVVGKFGTATVSYEELFA
jgi:D-glycero-beta-D-manno-heptose-7-phosphate kinase